MEFGLDFRKIFLDAYMAGKVTKVGLHSTEGGEWLKHYLRRGLKCKPSMFHVMRKELGVHWYVVVPKKEIPRMTRNQAESAFDNLCFSFGSFDRDRAEQELPGIVVLTENVPRSRFYEGKNSKGSISNQRYVPVLKGLENAINILVQPKNIIDIVFLSENEMSPIYDEAEKAYGSMLKIGYLEERGKISEKKADSLMWKRIDYINRNSGRLLLSKTRKYLIKN